MWYQGMGLSFVGWGFALGYAESPDGETWQKYAGNPVLEPGESGEWDSAYRGQVALIEDGGLYKMWFSGAGTSGPWQTGYATSTDGLDWEIYSGNPVLEVGAPGSWDEQEANGPTVLKDGAVYKMWYHGCNLDYSECSIGYATWATGSTGPSMPAIRCWRRRRVSGMNPAWVGHASLRTALPSKCGIAAMARLVTPLPRMGLPGPNTPLTRS